MRTLFFMSRLLATVILMTLGLVLAFVLLDVMRQGSHATGFRLGATLWHQVQMTLQPWF